jgi:hypothetical protein
MLLVTDERYEFPFDVESFWSRIERVDDYPRWWPWLRRFDAPALASGARWSCEVHPPLPYRVRFQVHLDEVVHRQHVDATITGDISGTARLTAEPAGRGCVVTLRSSLAPDARSLRLLSLAVRPMVSLGHRWILGAGARQFERRSHR